MLKLTIFFQKNWWKVLEKGSKKGAPVLPKFQHMQELGCANILSHMITKFKSIKFSGKYDCKYNLIVIIHMTSSQVVELLNPRPPMIKKKKPTSLW